MPPAILPSKPSAASYLRKALVPALADASRDGGWMERAGCCAEMGG